MYESLRETGPGQGDPLFPWLEGEATLDEMSWFIEQRLRARPVSRICSPWTQVKMPQTAKLEMARNYWDEMGRGAAKGLHGPMLDRLARYIWARIPRRTRSFPNRWRWAI